MCSKAPGTVEKSTEYSQASPSLSESLCIYVYNVDMYMYELIIKEWIDWVGAVVIYLVCNVYFFQIKNTF